LPFLIFFLVVSFGGMAVSYSGVWGGGHLALADLVCKHASSEENTTQQKQQQQQQQWCWCWC
jgi:hypothetical protein